MIIWIIVAMYQGTLQGVEFATLNEDLADEEYERLVREAMSMDYEWTWEKVQDSYSKAIDAQRHIDEYGIFRVSVT